MFNRCKTSPKRTKNEEKFGGIIMKKITAIACSRLMLATGVAAFSGCGKGKEEATAISQQLALLQTAVDQTEATLLKAGEDANAALDTAKASVQTTYDAVIKAIGNYSALANEYAEEVSANVQLKSQMFYTQFEEDYAAVITSARTNWANMKAALQESETVA